MKCLAKQCNVTPRVLHKSSILHLLDLKFEEELQLTHHGHLKSLCHDPTKFLTKSMISTTKYYVIDIYLSHKDTFTNFVRVGSALPISKPCLSKNSLRHSYHALGACLSP